MRHLVTVLLVLFTTAAHASTKESRAGGQVTFRTAGCAQCHGQDWSGTDDGPDLHGIGKSMDRDQLTKRIRNGGGGMPPFADALSDAQIVQLVDFLEAEKKMPKKPKQAAVKTSSPQAVKPKEDSDQ